MKVVAFFMGKIPLSYKLYGKEVISMNTKICYLYRDADNYKVHKTGRDAGKEIR